MKTEPVQTAKNVLPFRQDFQPAPLERVDVSRQTVTNPLVMAMLLQGWRQRIIGNQVLLVSPHAPPALVRTQNGNR